ncbi:MAG: GGDEF domain-containing protein, partial [Spirochaetales bacterium]|nr:GGDEF domain-containing protein [Spirochaetales bacterium]
IKHNATNYLIKDQLNKEDLSLAVNRAIFETRLNFKVKEQQEQILSLSRMDDLTNVFNRRYFIERLEEEINRCHRGGSFFSFALIDLDHFKIANDFYGHLAGDDILKIVAGCMKDNLRSTDYICRYGGDEFILVLVEDLYDDKLLVLDHHKEKIDIIRKLIIGKIQQYIESSDLNKRIFQEGEKPQKITLSIGITSFREDINDFNSLFHEADKALYFAKDSGRNCIACYDEVNESMTLYKRED